jgi:integrase
VPYAPWPQWAWELVPLMRRELRIACFLALYTGQRLGDVLRMQLGHIENGRVRVQQSKTGKELVIRLHMALRPVIEECRQTGTIYLVARENGSPFTVDQFHAMWGREMSPKKKRPTARIRREGFVFHGLRKSATCKLLEAGCSAKEVGAVTGMSLAMVEHYSKAVDQLRLGDQAIGKMEA